MIPERGSALITTLAFSIVLAGIGGGILMMAQNRHKAELDSETRRSIDQLSRSIQVEMTNPTTCNAILRGEQEGQLSRLAFASQSIGELISGGAISNHLVLDSLEIREHRNAAGDPAFPARAYQLDGTPYSLRQFQLRLGIRSGGLFTTIHREVLFFAGVDNSGRIHSCHTENSAAALCFAWGGAFDSSKPLGEQCIRCETGGVFSETADNPLTGQKDCAAGYDFVMISENPAVYQCVRQMCAPGERWGPWTPWSPCSAYCDGGTQTRTRIKLSGVFNNDMEQSQSRTCNPHSCPTSGTPKTDPFVLPAVAANIASRVLFIMDNSSSMKDDIRRVRTSISRIPASSYPTNTKVAVANIMIGRNNNFKRVSQSIGTYKGIDSEPGFLSLVNRATIRNFTKNQQVPSRIKGQFNQKGCGSWFNPKDKGPDRKLCVSAHTNIALTGIGCESGIGMLKQFFTRWRKTDWISKDAHLQVVIVSDEPSPGCKKAHAFQTCTKSPQELIDLAKKNPHIKSIKFHAIARKSLKDNPYGTDCDYSSYVTATGGTEIDIQKARQGDYNRVIGKIFNAAIIQDVTLTLSEANIVRINEIRINGVPFTGSSQLNGQELTIKDVDRSVEISVEVDFEHG